MPPIESVPLDLLDVLRCQQTLQPLTVHPAGLYSPAADVVYPVQNGLVFMGYAEREHEFLQTVMEEERIYQTSPENFARDLEFLKMTSVATVDLVNLVQATTNLGPGARGLEVGAGNGWVSWLFAEAGFDMWLCELEANSLALGRAFFDHPNLGVGKRIVSDGTLVPFADGTFDLVVCKEFAHHVMDKRRLFAEANRVLKPGGVLALMEPVRSAWLTMQEWRSPDPHTDHVIVWPREYLSAIRSRGFHIEQRGAYFYGPPGRTPLTAWIKRRANAALRNGHPRHDMITAGYECLIGSSLVALATKQHDLPQPPRPQIRLIRPLKTDARPELEPDYSVYLEVLHDAARRLERRAAREVVVAR